ncbi:hypothetical protein ACVTW2_000661 [Escherichia coli]
MKKILGATLLALCSSAYAGSFEQSLSECGGYIVHTASQMNRKGNSDVIRITKAGDTVVMFSDSTSKLYKIAWGINGEIAEDYAWNGNDMFILTTYPNQDPQGELHLKGSVISCSTVGTKTAAIPN